MAKEMNMQYEETSYAGDVQILKREPNEAIPLTLDFDGVTTKNAQGKKIVKAGTPIGANGKANNTAAVVGILRFDVTEDRPQGEYCLRKHILTQRQQKHTLALHMMQELRQLFQ